jgi:fructokinase
MILVCGEALIDLFVGEADGMGVSTRAVTGGSPFNVAVGLARLGIPTGFLGGISTDRFGRLLAETLAREGVETRFARRSPRPTPLVVVSSDADGQPSYDFHIHGCAEHDLGIADLPTEAFQAIVLGSYSLAVEPVGSALLALVERVGASAVVSLDPNLRPSIVGALEAWRRRFDRFVHTAAIVKLSREDLVTAYGQADPAMLAAGWFSLGVLLVVVTDGEKGVTAYHRDCTMHRPGRKIAVVDTVGAGDTFHAALLARLAQRGLLSCAALATLDAAALTDLLDYAGAAASITCTRQGADMPRAVDVEEVLHVPRA